DANGNILVAGYFYSSSIIFGSTTLTNAGSNTRDMFLAKYDASGNVLWAKSAGGSSFDEAYSVSTDANGNILVAGNFRSPTISFASTTLTKAGGNGDYTDMFLAKYDASGNVLWAKSAGGSDYDSAQSVSTDANGNILVAGYFQSPTLIFGSTTLTSMGSTDMFLAKLSPLNVVNELSSENSVSIYPNPNRGEFTVKMENVKGQRADAKIEIYNVYGEKVYSSIINNKSTIINLNVPNSIYFIQLKTEQGTINKKLIINK
ncbi:MAG: T9SS type A sorting domain-containing protein, partial [Bacteroidota bacterium]